MTYPGNLAGAQQANLSAAWEAKMAAVPGIANGDPIANLIAHNNRLQSENLQLRQQIYEHERQPRLTMPDWAIDPLTSKPSLMGLLVLRIQCLLQHQPLFSDCSAGAKFSYKDIAFIEAVADGMLPDCNVHVFVVVNGNPMLLQDQVGLWPSDSFITKILTLAGDQLESKF